MVEPTESEISLSSTDSSNAMVAIRHVIDMVLEAAWPLASSPLSQVRHVDGVHGDRNRVCAYPPPEAFATPTPAQPVNGPLLQESQT